MSHDFDSDDDHPHHDGTDVDNLGRIDFAEDQRRIDESDCLWGLKTAGFRQKCTWIMIYGLWLLSIIILILAGAARFNHSEKAGVALFVFQLLFAVPGNFALVYFLVRKKWLIVP